jgi:hypothetical protein
MCVCVSYDSHMKVMLFPYTARIDCYFGRTQSAFCYWEVASQSLNSCCLQLALQSAITDSVQIALRVSVAGLQSVDSLLNFTLPLHT